MKPNETLENLYDKGWQHQPLMMPDRLADDSDSIYKRRIELLYERLAAQLGRAPKLTGSATEHCDICPELSAERCHATCETARALWEKVQLL